MLPTTQKEAKDQGKPRYNNGKRCRNGHFSDRLTSTGQCCECKKEYQAKLREADPEVLRAKEKAYYERNKDDRIEYQKNRYHNILKHDEEWMEKNKARSREWQRTNWDVQYKRSYASRLSSVAARRSKLKKQLDNLSREYVDLLREIYDNCPDGMQVDHIVPLNGEAVCGLHVPWNLQYLSPSENNMKGNKYED